MNIKQARDLIQAADVSGHVPLIKGLHGIGKSDSAKFYAEDNNMHYEPLILSLMDTGDMLGLPETREVGGMPATVWSAPSWYNNIVNAAWPTTLKLDRLQFTDTEFQKYVVKRMVDNTIERGTLNQLYCDYYNLPSDILQILRQDNVSYLDSRRSVLNLDEFNRAPMDILNASLQLILDKRLHTHILPVVHGKETLIVAAVNPADRDYTVQEFDPALLDRFIECEVEADFKTWLEDYAKPKGLNQIVIDFLIDNQAKFHFTPKDGTKGTSPRTWTRLATYLDRIDSTNKDVMTHYVKGTLGSSVAAQFIMFYNNYGNGLTSKALDKLIKKEISAAKRAKKDLNPQELADAIEPVMEKVEAIQKMEFADYFLKTYINKNSAEEAMPLLVYYYSLPIETLSGALKSLQTDNPDYYANLAILDKEANNKKLFMKLVSHIKAFK